MKQNAIKIRGTKVPRFFVYLRGVFDGRITKKAGISQESGCLESAYTSRMTFLYNEACRNCAMNLEKDISSFRLEAATLLSELKEAGPASRRPDESDSKPAANTYTAPVSPNAPLRSGPAVNAAEARAARLAARESSNQAKAQATAEEERRKKAEERETEEKKRQESMIRLTQIQERMISKELLAEEMLAAASESIRALLCSYAHGALKDPVSERLVPEITYDCWLEDYRAAHAELDRKISKALQA